MFAPADVIKREFGVPEPSSITPRYNIAPSQSVAVIRADAQGLRSLDMLRWGLVPHWAKDPSIGNRLINARAETVAEKPAFRGALARRRCLVLASGFYEWGETPAGRSPYFVRSRTGDIMALAGLWERWESEDVPAFETCVILTTAANALLADVHERMPVILASDAQSGWLGADTVSESLALLRPAHPDSLAMWRVRRTVNNPKRDGPELIEPAPDSAP